MLSSDSKTLDAVVRNLEVIGEAVKMLPDEIRSRQPDVDWQKIAGLRDILIHRYFGIDPEIIQDTFRISCPCSRSSSASFWRTKTAGHGAPSPRPGRQPASCHPATSRSQRTRFSASAHAVRRLFVPLPVEMHSALS